MGSAPGAIHRPEPYWGRLAKQRLQAVPGSSSRGPRQAARSRSMRPAGASCGAELGVPAQPGAPVAPPPQAQRGRGIGAQAAVLGAVEGGGDRRLEAGAAQVQEGLAVQPGQVDGQFAALQQAHDGAGRGPAGCAGPGPGRCPIRPGPRPGPPGRPGRPGPGRRGGRSRRRPRPAGARPRAGPGRSRARSRTAVPACTGRIRSRYGPGSRARSPSTSTAERPRFRVEDQRKRRRHDAARNRVGGAVRASRAPVTGCSSSSFQACSQSWSEGLAVVVARRPPPGGPGGPGAPGSGGCGRCGARPPPRTRGTGPGSPRALAGRKSVRAGRGSSRSPEQP